MQSSATLIATLVYSRFPGIDFTELVDELDTALGGTGRWDGDTNAIFTVEGSRMVVGLEDHRGQPNHYRKLSMGAEATLVLSIGPGPDRVAPSPLEPHRHSLVSTLAERINRACPCDLMLWSETAEVFEPTRYAPLVALSSWYNADEPDWPDMALADVPLTVMGRRAAPQSIRVLTRKFHTLRLSVSVPSDLPPVLATKTATDARAAIGQTAYPDQIAARIAANAVLPAERSALPLMAIVAPPRITFGVTQAAEPVVPLPQRLTLYVMNMVLMLVALPLGFALLVFNMVRGEDLQTSARAIALASTLIGLAELAGIHNTMYLV